EQCKLLLASNGAIAGNISSINVNTGASLDLDNSAANHAGRIASNVHLAGGTLKLIGADGTSSIESPGQLTLTSGAASIVLQQGAGGTTQLTFTTLATS